jgi:hypothetical protein
MPNEMMKLVPSATLQAHTGKVPNFNIRRNFSIPEDYHGFLHSLQVNAGAVP